MADSPLIGMIWAQNPDGIIGDGTGMPWHVPEDLAHFKETTLNHPVIMGAGTWDSLPASFRPLPKRRNIVLSRSRADFAGAEHAHSLEAALEAVAGSDQVWIIGGGKVYAEALQHADLCVVTEIDLELQLETPVYAPDISAWKLIDQSDWHISRTGLHYRFSYYRSE